jgi:hypothetical protein
MASKYFRTFTLFGRAIADAAYVIVFPYKVSEQYRVDV